MRLVTLLAVALLGADAGDAGPGAAVDPVQARLPAQEVPGPVVDTSAVSPPLRTQGSMDPEKVREVVRSQGPALQACYEQALAQDVTLSGGCTVRIVVDRDGTVGSASIHHSSLGSLSLQRCVLERVRTWRFPPPGNGKAAAVEYPLVFLRGPGH